MADELVGEPPTRALWTVFALACGASFLLYLHRYTWNLVGPEIQDDLHLSNTQIGLLFSLFYYTYASGQIPSGVLVDRLGPRRVLPVLIVAWSIAIAALGWTSAFWALGLARLAFGAAQAGCYPGLAKATRNWFSAANRTVIQGWIATTSGRAGGAVSPLLMGTLMMGWLGLSWQLSLGLLGAAGCAYGWLFLAVFRDTPTDHPEVNEAERKLIAAGSEGEPASSPTTLSPRRAWRSRSLRFFALQQFLDAGSDVAFVSLIGAYFLKSKGLDLARTGSLSSLPLWGGALGGIAGGWLNDRWIARTGNRRWSRSGVGFVGKAVGCVLLLLVAGQSSVQAAGLVLMGAKFFSDWSQPTTWGAATDLGGRHGATVFSIVNTAGTAGGIVMPIVFGLVLDRFTTKVELLGRFTATTDWTPLFALLAFMYLGSGVCWLLVDCSRSLDQGAEDGPIPRR